MGKGRKRNFKEVSEKDESKEDPKLQEEIKQAKMEATFSLGYRCKNMSEKRLIIILEKASLESVKTNRTYELLNCDDHRGLMKKFKKDPAKYRPDILHQCLLMLQDSPLNQAGFLQVYIHTEKNVLIEIHPQCRIPRTFKRFAGLMVQLLHKHFIRASDESAKLLKVIKNPVTDYLPAGCKKILMSFACEKKVNPVELVPTNEPVAIVIGSMAHGKVDVDYAEEEYSISKYHLSAALTCAKVCSAFEQVWSL